MNELSKYYYVNEQGKLAYQREFFTSNQYYKELNGDREVVGVNLCNSSQLLLETEVSLFFTLQLTP